MASIRLVVLDMGIGEDGPDLPTGAGIGFSECLVGWCDSIDLRAAVAAESEG